LKRLVRIFNLWRRSSWHWHKPDKWATCGAWPRWTVGIDVPPWGIGARGESWGIRFILLRWHLCGHYPDANSALCVKTDVDSAAGLGGAVLEDTANAEHETRRVAM